MLYLILSKEQERRNNMKSWFVWGRNLPRLEIVSNSMDKALEKASQIDDKYNTCQLKEYEYAKSKNRLNSSFGMTIQKLAIDEITYTDKWEESKKELCEVLDFYYKSKNSFLIKQQGIYVTDHARRRLQESINICGADYVYGDTDSCKLLMRST